MMNIRTSRICGRALFTAFIIWPAILQARVALNIKLPIDKAMLNEPLTAEVSIRNNSGRVLSFGTLPDSAKLRFHIEDMNGRTLAPHGDERALLSGVDIMPGQARAFTLAISDYYRIRETRTYRISAVVDWGPVSYSSRNLWLDVVKGVELSRLNAGIPGDADAMRVYILEYIQRGREEHLYLRIEDDEQDIIHGVFNLGRFLRARRPVLKTDEPGNIHILFHTIGMHFIHTAYTPYGDFLFSNPIAGAATDSVSLDASPDGSLRAVVTRSSPVE